MSLVIPETTETCGFFIAGLLESAHSSILGARRFFEGGRENDQTFMQIRLVYAPVDCIDCGGEA